MTEFKRLEDLCEAVVDWHWDRNLIEGSSDVAQIEKVFEEVEELAADIEDGVEGDALQDELGDVLVVLINIAERNGFTLFDALEFSYLKIKDRKGRMISGVFVKEEDLV